VPGAGDSIAAKTVANAAIMGALGLSTEKVLDTKKLIEASAKKINEVPKAGTTFKSNAAL